MPRRLALFLLILPAFPQKKPVTLESLKSIKHETEQTPTWAPDGKTFLFLNDTSLRIYDPSKRTSRELLSTETLEKAAAKAPEEGAYGWTNRYVESAGPEFSATGKEVLYTAAGDLFLIHVEQ